ncbi:hypothetical protein F0562_006438 [Nyssa sinensis]|uniref:Uncharacterized protein n=1 Tax=Nyssa sinensis TaxID=561372 RepID=A0A5J5AL98_9ASTE|nr:hypothetical protein F0562_006438 [Nyssa sinensis]
MYKEEPMHQLFVFKWQLLPVLVDVQIFPPVLEYDLAFAGQIPGTAPAIPGMFPNMLTLASGQFGALPVMPVRAMTQQATRHA